MTYTTGSVWGSSVSVDERIRRVMSMTLGQLEIALVDQNTQPSVRKRIQARINNLKRLAAKEN
jgi:hypothetical protein